MKHDPRTTRRAPARSTRPAPPFDAELDIHELVPGGRGVAHLDHHDARRAVLLSGVLPGERVRARVTPGKPPFHAELLEVVRPSADRKDAECSIYGECGGCDWMHLQVQAQHTQHVALVARLLGVDAARIVHHAAPRPLAYRDRLRLHYGPGASKRSVLGFRRGESHTVVRPDTCEVAEPVLDRLRERVGEWLSAEPELQRAEVELASGQPGLPVLTLRVLRGEPSPALLARIDDAIQRGQLAGAHVHLPQAARPLRLGDPAPRGTGADGLPFEWPAGGFAQSSNAGNQLLGARFSHLLAQAAVGPESKVVELHAGSGNLSVLLARLTQHLVSYETAPEAVLAARANLASRQLRGQLREGDAETAELPRRLDLLVLDPPRSGARGVLERARQARVKKILYVSCDPVTLARDLRELGEDYAVRAIEVVEMFPQTSHVETLVLLERGGTSPAA